MRNTAAATSRRGFLQAQAAAVIGAGLGSAPLRWAMACEPAAAAPANDEAARSLRDKATAAKRRGHRFLLGLFDPVVELLPEYRGADVYWLYHDNYLAAKVLADTDQEMAARIERSIRRHGATASGKIEILFDESPRGFPFRQYELNEVARIKGRIIKTEIVTGEPFAGWREYVDLLLLAAIFKAGNDRDLAGARHDFAAAMGKWDGRGFRDRVTQKSGLYATYKLALALLAAARLRERPAALESVLTALLAQQADDGGWITDYNAEGERVGLANVETTSLAVLAIDRYSN
ncbi:MAG: twin-arginine translocation signal domain-containing protein [Pirellulales bacterium]